MAATRGIGTHMVEVDVHALQLEVGGTGEANKISDRHSFSTPISRRRREKIETYWPSPSRPCSPAMVCLEFS